MRKMGENNNEEISIFKRDKSTLMYLTKREVEEEKKYKYNTSKYNLQTS